MRISVIIPTINRPELANTIKSITPQLASGDEIIICSDKTGDWGATPRTKGMLQATGDILMWIDDDDVYTPDAFATVRACLKEKPHPHLFRMVRNKPFNDVIHKKHEVVRGNVSTQMFVVPNDKKRLGKWGVKYDGDFNFIESTLSLWGGNVVWREEVISVWR